LVVAQIVAIIWLGVASQSDGVLPALLCFGAVFSCCGPLPVALLIYGAVIRHALRGQGIRIGLFGICDADILVVESAARPRCTNCGEAVDATITTCPLCGQSLSGRTG
jgi:hypothetical protein